MPDYVEQSLPCFLYEASLSVLENYMNKPLYMKVAKKHLKNVVLTNLALLLEMRTKKISVQLCSPWERGDDEVKAKNVLPFGQHSLKRTQTWYFLLTKQSQKCDNVTMTIFTYVCFVHAKGLIRGLLANSSTTFS